MAKSIEVLCSATKKSGDPCRAPVVGESDRCIGHGSHANSVTRRLGGRNRSNLIRSTKFLSPRLERLASLARYHQDQVALTPNYGVACDRAKAAALMVNAELRVYQLGLEVLKLKDQNDRRS